MDRPTPAITHLSGARRGTTQWPSGDRLRVGPERDSEVRVHPEDLPGGTTEAAGDGLATLEWSGDGYELKAAPEPGVYVNGRKVDFVVLDSGDVVRIGAEGPALRVRFHEPGGRSGKTVREAMEDCVDCARYAGRNWLHKAMLILAGAPRELATQTTLWFRLGVIGALVALVAVVGLLWYRNLDLESRLAEETAQVESLRSLLSRAEQDTFTVEDFTEARSDLEGRLTEALDRVEALEARQTARGLVIAGAAPSVVFLQGAYGFAEPSTGRPLRFIDPQGDPVPASKRIGPFFTLEGSGPEVEILYTGTAFLVSREGDLLTNRHVAVPWEFDEDALSVMEMNFRPVMRRFIGYMPGAVEPFDVETVRQSDSHDVALLHCQVPPAGIEPLTMHADPPHPGEEVIVLGYPTGIRALVARSGREFIESLEAGQPVDFWTVAKMLAGGGHIAPLATVGVVGQVTASNVVYDAETTHGGSGGPVLDLEGRVVAVNAAIIPEFGGSNLGVPAVEAMKLLEHGKDR